MSDPTSGPQPTQEQGRPKPRRAPENQFLVYDLNASLVLAKTVREKGGDTCSPEQLGAWLDYKNTKGGGYVARVYAAKAFGLIETVQGKYRITPRAESILYEVTPQAKTQALRDAFMGVPMFRSIYERYKGTQLPVELGMNNLLRTYYHVPPDRVSTAYRVLMDSADSAGFFHQGRRTQLVEPVIGTPSFATPEATNDGGEASSERPGPKYWNGGRGGGSDGGSELPSRGKLLDGMWEELPEEQAWDEDGLAYWLETFERLLRVRYRVPKTQQVERSRV